MMMIIIYGNIFWCCPLLFEKNTGNFFSVQQDSRLSLLFLPTCGTYIVNFFCLFGKPWIEYRFNCTWIHFFSSWIKREKKENPYNCLILEMFWLLLLLLLVHNYVDNILYNNNYKTDIKKKIRFFWWTSLSLSLLGEILLGNLNWQQQQQKKIYTVVALSSNVMMMIVIFFKLK